MSNFFFRRRCAKRLAKIGSIVDTSYLVYLNNEDPMTFALRDDAYKYIKNYRDNNAIFKLQIFRIESYSL